MGTVWLAHDEVLARPVAVKEVTYPTVVSDEERELLEQRTMREARAAARLTSPRTTTVHDVVDEDGRPWIVMEYVESRTLGELMAERGPLPPVEVARIGLDLLDALEAAHGVDVVHRDVKPGNVLLDTEGRAWLTDFGIATSANDETFSEPGVLVGSPSYMAPERARGDEAGPFTDLWSLGATLYAAVEGHGPFDRTEAMATLLAVTTDPPDPPQRAGPLAPVLLDLLAKQPEERLSGWKARAALRAIVADASRPLPPPPAMPPHASPPPASPPQSPPAQSSPPPSSPPGSSSPPPSAPPDERRRFDDERVTRIDREDIARLASLAGRSFAEGAKRAAVAGLSAWAESTGPRQAPPPGRKQAERPAAPRRGRGASRQNRPESRPPQQPGPLALQKRRAVRWTMMVVSLIAAGLVLGVALVVYLVVISVR
jgi:serine/threonine protein kinase